jgi:hypothetical protein
VASRFPVRLSWLASLVPLTAGVLALIAVFYEAPTSAQAQADPLNRPAANAAEIAHKMQELKRKPIEPRLREKPKSEALQRIEAELDKIADKPAQTQRDLRERIKEMTSIEEQIKQRQLQLGERALKIQEQLSKLDRLSEQQQGGPASELQKALADGKLDQAKEALDKLAKKLQNNELTQEQKEQLGKQLQDLQDRLQKLAQQQEQKDQLQQLAREGKISQETLQRELERLNRDSEKLKDLQDLANKLGQCEECLKKGDTQEALDRLQQAADQLEKLDLNEQELKELQKNLDRLQEAKAASARGEQEGNERGGKDGQGKDGQGSGGSRNPIVQPKDGATGRGIGAGKRPLGKESPTNSIDAKQRAHFDTKGKKLFGGHAPGENFKSKTSPELAGEIQQASQEAPEAIEHQQIPKAARDMAKEYFRNLGNQQK